MANQGIRVIAMPDEYTIYVNSGSENKLLKKGHVLMVVETGYELFDTDGKSLGNAMRVKEEVEVVQVYPKYSVCRKRDLDALSFNKHFSLDSKSSYSKLNLNKDSIQPAFSGEVSPIEIGDLVIIK
ncbi:hypothetical protein [Tindallia californiensis]|uniref:Uncharacterized protein n=1 Tax=Tindallia californiensis TaxID=159292 RepID=A0A1H3QZI4_9FIRM|nr:hypothetical protein [Tindallia californiensis]SDZ18766.1 hypothetical protein SAMN05192546_11145 [Tindallia californiensis]